FLPTEPITRRYRAIRPIATISDDDDDPYWKDYIEKYFARPHGEEFESITYPDYFKNYRLQTKSPPASSHSRIYKDNLNYYVIKRKNPIIVRYKYLKPQDGDTYFYQQLLLTKPCRSEAELRGNHKTYRAHFLHLHPDFQHALTEQTNATMTQCYNTLNMQFEHVITTFLNDIQSIVTPKIAK